MLQTLRKGASGIVAKMLMGLLILSFAIWGIADVFRGFGSQTLATIGSTEITVPEFRQIYQERIQQISQQIKRGLTPDQARAIGLPQQILNERLAEAALDDRVKQLGLALSDDEIAKRIRENPAFRGPSGSFDPNYFAQILRSNGFTEARFVDAERRLALRQQFIEALGGGMSVPQTLRDAISRYESEQRTVSYVLMNLPSTAEIADPGEEALRTFFDARKIAFKAPEFRKVSVLLLTPESVASTIEISDADIKAAYEANLAQFGTPEKRVVQQIVFPNADEARAAAEKIAAGTSFADIAAERKLDAKDIDLGDISRDEILDKAVADAAFALPADGTSGVVQGRFGPVIVHVGAVTPGTTKPLEAVSAELRTVLQAERAGRLLHDKHDQIEDERAGGAKLGEIASKLGLKLVEVDTDRQGRTPAGEAIAPLPDQATIITGAFDSDVDTENDPVQLANNAGYAWYAVEAITPPRDRTFEEAKAQVLDRWRQDEAAKQLDEKLAALKQKIDGGTPFVDAVTADGFELRTASDLRRGRASSEGFPQSAIAAVFETKQGATGSAPTENDGRVLFQVTNILTPTGTAQDEKLIADLGRSLEQDLMTEYLVRLQSDLGVRINRVALDQIVGGEPVN